MRPKNRFLGVFYPYSGVFFMDLPQCVLLWMQNIKAKSTREVYAIAIQQFNEWMNVNYFQPEFPEEITRHHCLEWWRELARRYGRKRDDGTIVVIKQTAQNKFAALASLLRWCYENGHSTGNPTMGILRGRRTRGIPRYAVGLGTVQKILAWSAERAQSSLKLVGGELPRTADTRHLTFVLLATTGARIGEITNLEAGDFQDGANPSLTFLAKGAKAHRVYIHEDTAEAIREYLVKYPRKPHEHLLDFDAKKERGRRIRAQAWLKKACSTLNLPVLKCHQFRSTLATELHLQGVPMSDIQRLLGHTTITMTARYVQLVDEQRQAAALRIKVLPEGARA